MKNDTTGPLIVGHRGASAQAPENTLAAFKLAIDQDAEGLEFDVRLAKDRVPVVIHDETLVRTGQLKALVSELTSKQLGKIDVGSWFDKTSAKTTRSPFRGERVPTLFQTLEFLRDFKGLVFVELKCGEHEVEPLTDAVCEVVKDSPIASRIIVKSFKLAVIPRVRVLAPGLRTAALFAPKIMNILRKEKYLVNIAGEFGADELSIHYSLATQKLMESADKQSFPVTIWTADNPRWIKRGMRLGLKAIITNDPAKLLARRKQCLTEA